ncbi:SDR family oxidoreductase [Bacillus pinisoli]|uniref:SDR family oxidoreductase n=1 Tax=Bacillus pinisoli TaxID=2901866 RepID=UPI001FF3B1A4
MNRSLEGKVVIITGAKRGIGKATATLLASEGACVWITSRQVQSPHEYPVAQPGEVQEVFLDVTDEKSVVTLFEKALSTFGKVDALINNAGIGIFKPVEETTLYEWQNVINTNLTGVFLCCREAFALMKHQGGGRIINISSISGYIPLANNGVYGASKHAINGLSQILNEEGKHENIRVSIVSPGAVLTEMTANIEGLRSEDMLNPEDVAESILDIVRRPLHVRIDEVKIFPSKGVL